MPDPKVFTLTNPKGGTGKSTLALLLAYSKSFKRRYKRVALVEMDPQGSLSGWAEDRPEGDHVVFRQVLGRNPAPALEAIAGDVGAIIIDSPGESVDSFSTKFALAVASLVIVPCRASEFDLNAANKNLWAGVLASGAPSCLVPTFYHPSASVAKVAAYMAEYSPEGVTVLPHGLATRSVYQVFPDSGSTLAEYAAHGSRKRQEQGTKAAAEVEELAREILKHA